MAMHNQVTNLNDVTAADVLGINCYFCYPSYTVTFVNIATFLSLLVLLPCYPCCLFIFVTIITSFVIVTLNVTFLTIAILLLV